MFEVRTARLFMALLALLAVCTAGALVVLWPDGERRPLLSPALRAQTAEARIKRVVEVRCPAGQPGVCRDAQIELVDGPRRGERSRLALSGGALDPDLDPGDAVRVVRNEVPPGADPGVIAPYAFVDFERRKPLVWLALGFGGLVVLLGRLRGALSLVGLAVSLLIVATFVVPAILEGKSPLGVALAGSFAVMFATIPLAHGLRAKSIAAMLGTAGSLLLTAALAVLFTRLAQLTGFSSEEATLLQAGGADLSLDGLLVAGMVIAALGVLDDVTVSQASTVLAVRAADPRQRFGALYRRGLAVGQDHVTATVNTLVLAYVGASLPALLVFSAGGIGELDAVNLELVAKEIVGTLVGSIGLIAAVPLTTALAALLAERLPNEALADASAHAH
jgi:uncharacterized membrane protein